MYAVSLFLLTIYTYTFMQVFSNICAPKVWEWSFIKWLNTQLILHDISGCPQSATGTVILSCLFEQGFEYYILNYFDPVCILLKTIIELIYFAGILMLWELYCMETFGSCMEFGWRWTCSEYHGLWLCWTFSLECWPDFDAPSFLHHCKLWSTSVLQVTLFLSYQ